MSFIAQAKPDSAAGNCLTSLFRHCVDSSGMSQVVCTMVCTQPSLPQTHLVAGVRTVVVRGFCTQTVYASTNYCADEDMRDMCTWPHDLISRTKSTIRKTRFVSGVDGAFLRPSRSMMYVNCMSHWQGLAQQQTSTSEIHSHQATLLGQFIDSCIFVDLSPFPPCSRVLRVGQDSAALPPGEAV